MPAKNSSPISHLNEKDLIEIIEKYNSLKEVALFLDIKYDCLMFRLKQLKLKGKLYTKLNNSLINKKFEKLIVKRVLDKRSKYRDIMLECECECGKIYIASHTRMKKGAIKSCGCLRYRKRIGLVPSYYFSNILFRSKKKNMEMNLDYKYISDLFIEQNGRCALSGEEIVFRENGKKGNASLDRIDSNKGYIIGNVQWVHKDVNFMKFYLDIERFKYLCIQIANKTEKDKNAD